MYESRAWLGSEPLEGHVQNAIQQEKAEVPGRANSIFLASQFRETPDITANRFGFYQTAGRVQDIMKVLTQLEPRLTGLVPVVVEDTALMHAQFKDEDKPIPIELLGEGTNRLLSLALAFRQAKGGFLLVDAIDNGLHYSVQADVFEKLFDLSQAYDVQVFATTHSAECIYAAHQALGNLEQCDFAFCRLDRGRKDAVYFDNEMLDTARAFALEIR